MKRILAALLSFSAVFTFAGCETKTDVPEQALSVQSSSIDEVRREVGTIGETVFTVGMYQLLRLNTAKENPGMDAEGLKEKTLEAMERYAAVEYEFVQLRGKLGEETNQKARSYGDQLWESSSEVMEANQIDREAVDRYLESLYKEDALMGLLYGEDGTEALTNQQILDHVRQNFYYGVCLYLPLTGEGNQEAVVELAQQAAQKLDEGEAMEAVAETFLPQVCQVNGEAWDSSRLSSYYYENMFTPENEAANLSSQAIEALHQTAIGEVVVLVNDSNVTVFHRQDPEEVYTAEDMRLYVTSRMKGQELEERLKTRGEELPHQLNQEVISSLEQLQLILE